MLSQEEFTGKLGLQKQNEVKNVGIFWVYITKPAALGKTPDLYRERRVFVGL